MDARGARELTKRIEAQQHWCQAEAVQRGEQPTADPDRLDLEDTGEGIRYYRKGTNRFCKRLVDGRWESSPEGEESEDFQDPAERAS